MEEEGEITDDEREVVGKARQRYGVRAVVLKGVIDVEYGTRIPHNRIHRMLKEMGLAREEPKKRKRRKWVRYEREYCNSLWYADWTLIPGKGWMIDILPGRRVQVRRKVRHIPGGHVTAFRGSAGEGHIQVCEAGVHTHRQGDTFLRHGG
ncbi:MAG: hypothetical protein QXX17_07825 [Conexivisphaerales archaeon]